MKHTCYALIGASIILSSHAHATEEHTHHHNHQSHAPIGIMGDHTHNEGEWMTSYRYSHMRMKGNRDGTSDVSTADVLSDFMVAPTEMTMEMHMFGVMYGVTDYFTAMAMIPYVSKSMDHVTRMGVSFETESKGIGDLKLSGLYKLYQHGHHSVHVNAGISVPTGSIDKRDDTPAGNVRLPYPMQIGSGTYDLLPGITYTGHNTNWSWGGQLATVIRLGENDNDYRLGHEYKVNAWGARKLNQYVNGSLRIEGMAWGDVSGADPSLVPMMVPTARTDLRGGERVDAFIGLDLHIPQFKDNRFTAEFGIPVYQRLDGPQLESDYRLIVGWQFYL